MLKKFIDFIMFKIVKVSGCAYIAAIGLAMTATGQSEISYKFLGYNIVMTLAVLIIARIEGHRSGYYRGYNEGYNRALEDCRALEDNGLGHKTLDERPHSLT